MSVLVTGAGGQLGRELARTAPPGEEVHHLGRDLLDVTDAVKVRATVATLRPRLIINAAAYTAVDQAEHDRERAFQVNGAGAGHLATAAAAQQAVLIQVSSDFVFDGRQSSPYRPQDPVNPLSVYGASKLEGETRVAAAGEGCHVILRTAWVYAAHGKNFVNTMLRLLGERESLGVVADQVGTPTWAHTLAETIWLAAAREVTGIHHWTDAGVASWYDFAVAIQEEALALGLLRHAIPVHPITTREYPTPATRPAFSVLDKTDTWAALGRQSAHWRSCLRRMLEEMRDLQPG